MEENKELSFEEALAKLEEIVHALESGNAPLDKSLEMFENGVSLVKLCNEKLDNAQRQIKILVNDGENISEKDYIKNDNE